MARDVSSPRTPLPPASANGRLIEPPKPRTSILNGRASRISAATPPRDELHGVMANSTETWRTCVVTSTLATWKKNSPCRPVLEGTSGEEGLELEIRLWRTTHPSAHKLLPTPSLPLTRGPSGQKGSAVSSPRGRLPDPGLSRWCRDGPATTDLSALSPRSHGLRSGPRRSANSPLSTRSITVSRKPIMPTLYAYHLHRAYYSTMRRTGE